ncbi:hypothetical protein Misp01_19350 [Microtetraspora sp. NBRC 13810]|uniref:acetyl-CoA carboxylase biotin carboxyl carrier protein n=1 Tax=Microtetraspora sp. NBRC 13810 TaxID=3030990 RepID=UPI0024A46285|nr:biotin/lipoyl-containing protein [Microtetraspora sp. NBRC 13810]GLW06805.1 hypothetical protein Misp01_19350 [Microtetraspora sp. NBRC 13810]
MNDRLTAAPPHGLEDLRRHVTGLIEAVGGPLKSIRVQTGDLTVEIEWPEPGLPPDGRFAGGHIPNGHAADGREAAPAEPAPPGRSEPGSEPDDDTFVVSAPLVGTFYRASAPGAPAFADVGGEVAAGQQVAIVEAMKMMNAVNIDRPGRVVEVLVSDGSPVEFGEALFVLAPL